MSNKIQNFVNEKFDWKIRIILIDGEPWFVGKDVATSLGYKRERDAIQDLVPDKFKLRRQITASGQKREVVLINEAGLYKLIMRSKLPNAEKFSDWCCEEILPSIRKTGMYVTEQKKYELINNPDAIIEICNQWKQEIEKNKQLTKELEIAKPKANYCDNVLQSESLVTITAIAQDYGYTAVSFNRLLKELGVQYKRGDMWVLYQEYIDKGWVQSKTYIYDKRNNSTKMHTYWTQKGRLGLYQLLKQFNYLPLIEQEDK